MKCFYPNMIMIYNEEHKTKNARRRTQDEERKTKNARRI